MKKATAIRSVNSRGAYKVITRLASVLLLLILLLPAPSVGQTSYGFGAGPNITVIGLTSRKDVKSDVVAYPWFGFHLSAIARKETRTKHILEGSLSFVQKRNRETSPFILKDEQGAILGRYDKTAIINNSLVIGGSYAYQVTDLVAVGIGLNFNFLLRSSSRITDKDLSSAISYRNYYFTPLTVGLPVFLGYRFDRVLLKLKFEKGIMSRISNSEIKERENVFSVELGYLLNRKSGKNE